MTTRAKPLPVIGVEQISANRHRATCVDCPDWHGPRRDTYATAREDGKTHLVTDHGAPACPST